MGWGEAAEPSAAIVVRDLRAQLDVARDLLDAYRELVDAQDEWFGIEDVICAPGVVEAAASRLHAAQARVAELEREGDGRG